MKTKLNLFNLLQLLGIITVSALAQTAALAAATNKPPETEFSQAKSAIFSGMQVYSLRFPGGQASAFFSLLKSNGFANDTIVFAGRAGEVWAPSFTVRDVQLKEIAKTLEFVTEGKLIVEMVMQGNGGDVNIWRIKQADRLASDLKTRACAVPNLLTGAKSNDRVMEIVDQVNRLLMDASYEQNRDDSRAPRGRITVIQSEKIVVAVGAEAYVEAIASALEAAERVAATNAPQKKINF